MARDRFWKDCLRKVDRLYITFLSVAHRSGIYLQHNPQWRFATERIRIVATGFVFFHLPCKWVCWLIPVRDIAMENGHCSFNRLIIRNTIPEPKTESLNPIKLKA